MDIPVGFKISQYKDPEKKAAFHGSCQPRVSITAQFAFFCVFEHGPTRKLEKQEMHYHFCGVGWHGTTEESLVVCLRYMCG